MSLAGQPSDSVTVAVYKSSNLSHVTASSPSVTLTTSNRNRGQEVAVSVSEDMHLVDGEAIIRDTASEGSYDSVTGSVTATEDDNDSPGFASPRTGR